jgi:hypothetical protein
MIWDGGSKSKSHQPARPPTWRRDSAGSIQPISQGFCTIARSSLMESQNHLLDFVDKRYITEDVRLELNQLAETALEEVTGLMEYLQSPEALRNARRARERRIASRPQRRSENKEHRTRSTPRGTKNGERRTEPRTQNRTPNSEPNPELRTEPRTQNGTPNRTLKVNTNRARRTQKGELF